MSTQAQRYHWKSEGHNFHVLFNSRSEFSSQHVELVDVPSGFVWLLFDRPFIELLRREAVAIA